MIPEAFGGLMLAAFCGGMLAMWPFAHRAGLHDGYEEGRADRHEAQLEERRHGRHERTGPQAPLVRDGGASPAARPAPRPQPSRRPWYRETGPVQLGWPHGPSHIAASGIAPVILPEPGAYPPQARRDSGAGTVTFPRVRLTTADTGEIRALGDEMVAAIEAAGGA